MEDGNERRTVLRKGRVHRAREIMVESTSRSPRTFAIRSSALTSMTSAQAGETDLNELRRRLAATDWDIRLNIPIVSAAMDTGEAAWPRHGAAADRRNPQTHAIDVRPRSDKVNVSRRGPTSIRAMRPDSSKRSGDGDVQISGVPGTTRTADRRISPTAIPFRTRSISVYERMTRTPDQVPSHDARAAPSSASPQHREDLVVDQNGDLKASHVKTSEARRYRRPKDSLGRLRVDAATAGERRHHTALAALIDAKVEVSSSIRRRDSRRARHHTPVQERVSEHDAQRRQCRDIRRRDHLCELGVDAIKVGHRTGSICTTRSFGCRRSAITAIMRGRARGGEADVPISATAGIKFSGDIPRHRRRCHCV